MAITRQASEVSADFGSHWGREVWPLAITGCLLRAQASRHLPRGPVFLREPELPQLASRQVERRPWSALESLLRRVVESALHPHHLHHHHHPVGGVPQQRWCHRCRRRVTSTQWEQLPVLPPRGLRPCWYRWRLLSDWAEGHLHLALRALRLGQRALQLLRRHDPLWRMRVLPPPVHRRLGRAGE